MKRTHLLRLRPRLEPEPVPASTPKPGPQPAPGTHGMMITVNVFEGRSFHLLPTPRVLSHLRQNPTILRQWFPVTLGNKRYVVTLSGKGWQQSVTVQCRARLVC